MKTTTYSSFPWASIIIHVLYCYFTRLVLINQVSQLGVGVLGGSTELGLMKTATS